MKDNPQKSGQSSKTVSAEDRNIAAKDESAKIKVELDETKKKLEEMTEISQRALADLQNYKRRIEEEKAVFITFANAALLVELLPSIDNIYRALEHNNKDSEWAKGVEQTLTQLTQSLEKIGLKKIEAKGQKFDPNLHEALLTAPGEKDLILEELEKGYLLDDKVLKQARVKVGNGEKEENAPKKPQETIEKEEVPEKELV